MNIEKQIRGLDRAAKAEAARQSAQSRIASKRNDTVVAVDLRTCVGYSTDQNPQETVNRLLQQ